MGGGKRRGGEEERAGEYERRAEKRGKYDQEKRGVLQSNNFRRWNLNIMRWMLCTWYLLKWFQPAVVCSDSAVIHLVTAFGALLIHIMQKKKSCSNALCTMFLKITGLEFCIRGNKTYCTVSVDAAFKRCQYAAFFLNTWRNPLSQPLPFFLMQLAHTLSWWGFNPKPMLQICLRIFPPKSRRSQNATGGRRPDA